MTRGRNRDKDNAYKRSLYKSEAPGIHSSKGDRVSRIAATYDPQRDPALQYADLTAELMRDPPIGRRAIDTKGSPP